MLYISAYSHGTDIRTASLRQSNEYPRCMFYWRTGKIIMGMNVLSGVALWEGITLVDMAYYSLRVAIWNAILSAELPFVTAVKRKLNSLLESKH